ncbi:MAG TPA: cadherin repeat domain-containing protein, partial [Planctomycetaceae bacterium]
MRLADWLRSLRVRAAELTARPAGPRAGRRRRDPAAAAERLENRTLLTAPPHFASETFDFAVSKHETGLALVGTVRATDPDGDPVSYAIASDPSGKFSVHGT